MAATDRDPHAALLDILQDAANAAASASAVTTAQERQIAALTGEVAELTARCAQLERALREVTARAEQERRACAESGAQAAEELRAQRQAAAAELARAARTIQGLADRQHRLSSAPGPAGSASVRRKAVDIESDGDADDDDDSGAGPSKRRAVTRVGDAERTGIIAVAPSGADPPPKSPVSAASSRAPSVNPNPNPNPRYHGHHVRRGEQQAVRRRVRPAEEVSYFVRLSPGAGAGAGAL
ncbi:hypothetical protein B0H15DRAFT_536099 [Mycena belliarum]|uniref:Uncharacterized protein n=1 Tax=Mycena belliarum TaxID=1033014 RepID=A0AAD6TXC7_9AGAR|nr:hypothetical protein B0H15DRAFT_536099 [Mycena belliae]